MFISGALDKEMSLAWVICRNRLFIWSYLSHNSSSNCIVLDLPPGIRKDSASSKSSLSSTDWLICFLNWDGLNRTAHKQCSSAGVILCSGSSQTLLYWPDIYSEAGRAPVVSYGFVEGSGDVIASYFNSMIATPVPNARNVCISLACSSNGELWMFSCNPLSVERENVFQNIPRTSNAGTDVNQSVGSKGYPRSLTWHPLVSLDKSERQFFLLTDHEIQCFTVKLRPGYDVSQHWRHEIVGNDSDLGIQKNLAGQKYIWALDLQNDSDGKVFTMKIEMLVCFSRNY